MIVKLFQGGEWVKHCLEEVKLFHPPKLVKHGRGEVKQLFYRHRVSGFKKKVQQFHPHKMVKHGIGGVKQFHPRKMVKHQNLVRNSFRVEMPHEGRPLDW